LGRKSNFGVARRGAHLAAERVGAGRRRKSEAQPNGEGVASGSATQKTNFKKLTNHQILIKSATDD